MFVFFSSSLPHYCYIFWGLEIAQWWTLAALEEDPFLPLVSTWCLTTLSNSSSRVWNALFWPLWELAMLVQTYVQAKHYQNELFLILTIVVNESLHNSLRCAGCEGCPCSSAPARDRSRDLSLLWGLLVDLGLISVPPRLTNQTHPLLSRNECRAWFLTEETGNWKCTSSAEY